PRTNRLPERRVSSRTRNAYFLCPLGQLVESLDLDLIVWRHLFNARVVAIEATSRPKEIEGVRCRVDGSEVTEEVRPVLQPTSPPSFRIDLRDRFSEGASRSGQFCYSDGSTARQIAVRDSERPVDVFRRSQRWA